MTDESIEEELNGEPTEEVTEEAESIWQRILSADSRDMPISEYSVHPLNFDGKESTGRIIKGFEGILGNLNKAVVDIAIGVIQKVMEAFKEKKNEP